MTVLSHASGLPRYLNPVLHASGQEQMTRTGQRYTISQPRRRGPDARPDLPAGVGPMMRLLGIDDFLEFEKADDGTYQLGARVFGLVASAAMHGDQAAAVNRVLQDLCDLTGETASLHVRRGDQRVCVASATSRHQLRRVIPIGDAVSLVGTVPGDIFLAGEPETERDELVSAVLSGRARRAELEKIQFAADHGYSVARQHDLHKAAKRLEPWMEADWFVTRNGLGPRLAKRRTSSSSVSRKMSGDRLGHVGRSGSCVCLGASGRVVTWRRR